MGKITDRLGNEFKPGQIVQVRLTDPLILAQVQDVATGGVLTASDMVIPGRLVLAVILPIDVLPDRPVDNVWVLQQPPPPPKVSSPS